MANRIIRGGKQDDKSRPTGMIRGGKQDNKRRQTGKLRCVEEVNRITKRWQTG